MYDLLPEPEDEENDMLDMAFGLTDTLVVPLPPSATTPSMFPFLASLAAWVGHKV